jgi:hypothetical protein
MFGITCEGKCEDLLTQRSCGLPNILDIDWVLISPPDIKDKWVPILASEFKWGKSVNDDSNHSRKQLLICLAWALTVWKSQGMTIKGLVKYIKVRQSRVW